MAIKPTSKTIVTAGTDAGLTGIDHAAHTAILANSKGNTASYSVVTDKAVYVTNVIENNTTAFVKNDAVDNPGGTQGQFQYNDNGNLAGVPGMTYSPNGVVSVNNLSVNNFNIPGGVAGQVLGTTGGAVTWVSADSAVAGSNGQVQFNDAGVLGASPAFTFNKTSNTMIAGNIATNRVNGLVTARITGLSDATNKEYVDGKVGGLAADVADIDSKVVYSVNGITPINGNVPVNLVGTETGTSLPTRPTPVNGVTDGVVFIISGASGARAAENGTAYIFSNPTNSPTTGTWLEISPPGQASSDLRYVNLSGDTMAGSLILDAGQMTGATGQHAATKGYVDSVMGSSTLVGLTDVEFNVAPVADQILKYDGFKWVNSPALSMNATNITTTPGGNITSTNVQAALAELDSKKVSKSGDTMAGALNINVAPTPASNNAATTNYVDAADALKVAKAGDTMTGPLILSGAPTANLGAATKGYVDDKIAPQSTVTIADAGKAPKLGSNGRLDLSAMATGVILKVNGALPDADGEVTVNIVATITGNLAEFAAKTPPPPAPGGQRDGIMFIISGETGDPTQNGSVYIWSIDAINPGTGLPGTWLEVSPPGTESNDIRYVRKGGDKMAGLIDMDSFRITGLPAPIADDHAATKKYIDDRDIILSSSIASAVSALDGKVAKVGDSMTGPLVLPANYDNGGSTVAYPGLNQHAATKAYVDGRVGSAVGNVLTGVTPLAAGNVSFTSGSTISATNVQAALLELGNEKVAKAGDTMTGSLILSAGQMTSATNLHAATKKYVDDVEVKADQALALLDTTVFTVNGISPINNNIALNLSTTLTGTLGNRPLTSTDGEIYIVSGDSTASNNGLAFIWASGSWRPLSSFVVAEGDARYILKTGDTMAGDLNMGGSNQVVGLPAPGNAGDAVNKAYVDNKDNLLQANITTLTGDVAALGTGKVAKAGDTMSGPLTLNADPTAPLVAATKQYVDVTAAAAAATRVATSGGTMTGRLRLTDVANQPLAPTSPEDAANRKYVDDSIAAAVITAAGGGTVATAVNVSDSGNLTAVNGVTNAQEALEWLDNYKVAKAGDKMTGYLELNADPVSTNPTHIRYAATRNYVDDQFGTTVGKAPTVGADGKLPLSTMAEGVVLRVNGIPATNGNVTINLSATSTGTLAGRPIPSISIDDGSIYIVSNDGTDDGLAYIYSTATSQWLEISPPGIASSDARYLRLAGGTMEGAINMFDGTTRHNITGLPEPTLATHPATKKYVDDLTLNDISDVDVASANNNDILRFNGTKWVPGVAPAQNAASITVAPAVAGATDVQTALTTLNTAAGNKLPLAGGTMNNGASITMNGGSIIGLPNVPGGSSHAASKQYVDDKIAQAGVTTPGSSVTVDAYDDINEGLGVATLSLQSAVTKLADQRVKKDGDTMTGNLILSRDPELSLEAATKQYVDNAVLSATPTGTLVTLGTTALDAGEEVFVIEGLTSVTADDFIGNLVGTASNATSLATARNFSISGDITAAAVSFNGTAPVLLNTTLGTVNTPTTDAFVKVTTDAKGRVTASTPVSATNITGVLTTGGNVTLPTLVVQGTTNLGAVGNVTITGGSTGQVLTTNGSGVLSWNTVAAGGTTVARLDDIGDVSVAGATNGQFLQWNGSNWIPQNVSLTGIPASGITYNNAASSLTATNVQDAITAVDGKFGSYLPLAGGTMTGDIVMGGTGNVNVAATPTQGVHLTNKTYVDAQVATAKVAGNVVFISANGISATNVQAALAELGAEKANLAGATFTGAVTLPAQTLATTGDDLAATIKYVDLKIQGVAGGAVTSADKLTTARNIAMTGDGTWSVNFDGSAPVTAAMTLAAVTNSGTGTFQKLTIDSKGRVTGTAPVTTADITILANSSYVNVGGDTMTGTLNVPTINVTANATLGAVANVHISGGSSGQFLQTNGSGDLTWATVSAAASGITVTPAGNIAATDVQAALVELDSEAVRKAGSTMTGLLTLSGAPSADLHAATKQYVDDGLATKLNTAGGTMTDFLTLNADPSADLHAATKKYVDSKAAGLTPGGSSRVATGANIDLSNPGTTISGVTMAPNDRVLVKNQTTLADNGIYVWNGAGVPMTRAADFTGALIANGFTTFIVEGTLGGTTWISANLANPYTNGPINFTQFGGSATITGGTGITFATNTITNDGVLTVGAGAGMSVTGVGSGPYKGAVTVTNTGVLSLAGTTNQINVSSSTGTVTLSIPNNPTLPGNVTATGFIGNGAQLSNITGANVSGAVALATLATTATSATTAGTVTTAAQPNITSVGTLTSLTSSGTITGALFSGSGASLTNLPAANVVGTVPTATTAGTVTTAAQPNITSVGTLTSLTSSGTITGALFSGNGASLTNLPAANIVGTVPIAQGGTGQTTAAAAFSALSPITAAGDLIVGTAGNDGRLGIGSTGQVLTVVAGTPVWRNTQVSDAGEILLAPFGNLVSENVAEVIEEIDEKKLSLTGGTMTGAIIQTVAPTDANHLITMSYADTTYVNVAGDTMTGNLNMGASFVKSTAVPTANDHLVNKLYVDNVLGGVNGTITIGTTGISLGGSSTTLAGLTSVTSTTFVGALSGAATSAGTLTTARNIAMSGDGTWDVNFNGSGNVTAAMALKNTGTPVTGQFAKITTDAAGRVSATTPVVVGDITALLGGTPVVAVSQGTGIGVAAGTGIGNVVVTNTGVTSVAAGQGITVNQGTGAVTVTNSGILGIDAGAGITVGPRQANGNVQISATATGVTAISGTSGQITATNTGGGSYTLSIPNDPTLTGTVNATNFSATGGFSGSGAQLTNLNVANVASGTLAISHGGTGQTTATAAFNALSPTTTGGDTIYHDGANDIRLPVGTAGQVLTVAANSRPSWQDAVTKTYVDTQDALKVSKAGDVMSGSLSLVGVYETAVAVTPDGGQNVVINLTLGTYFKVNIIGNGNSTLLAPNGISAGKSHSFVLDVTMNGTGGGFGISALWASALWSGGVRPTLTPGGRDLIGFTSYNGTEWIATVLAKDVR